MPKPTLAAILARLEAVEARLAAIDEKLAKHAEELDGLNWDTGSIGDVMLGIYAEAMGRLKMSDAAVERAKREIAEQIKGALRRDRGLPGRGDGMDWPTERN